MKRVVRRVVRAEEQQRRGLKGGHAVGDEHDLDGHESGSDEEVTARRLVITRTKKSKGP